jgi:hypothetical protein
MLSLNAILYTVVFAVIAYGASTIWGKAPLGQRVHLAGAWSPTALFVEGRNPRLVGWAVGLSVVLVVMALVARHQRLPQPWYQPLRSAALAGVPLVAFAAALVTLAR